MISLVIEAAVRSSALVVAVWLVLTLTRLRNPHLQKMTWSTVALVALAMPFLMRAHVAPMIHTPNYVLTLQAGTLVSSHSQPVWASLEALYMLVCAALLLRYARNLQRMWRIRRDASALELDQHWIAHLEKAGLDPDDLDVRSSTSIHTPATFGTTILLPVESTQWSWQKLTAVLAHEQAHVAHRDCYLLWLARLHTCLFWFNPWAWWIQRHLANLAETTSDEAAAEALGDRPGYAEILLDFANHGAASDVATAMARSNISRRIDRILSGIAPCAAPKPLQRILVLAALVPAVAATAANLRTMPTQLVSAHTAQADGSSSGSIPSSPPNTQTRTADSDPVSGEPSVKSWPTLSELMKYYPSEAERKGIEGLVRIRVTLDAQGRATDTLILTEAPLETGFGAAASALAHVLEYNNPTSRPAQLEFKVKFALSQQSSSGTTHFEESNTP